MGEPLIPPVADDDALWGALPILAGPDGPSGVPANALRTTAHSPASLESLVAQMSATARMRIPPRTREAIGLRVAELHGCHYALAAHTARAERCGIDAVTARRFRLGLSDDPKEQALLALATKVVLERGHHAGFVVETARRAGASDAEVIEVISLVGLSTFVDYLSSLASTTIDHPAADDLGPGRADSHLDC